MLDNMVAFLLLEETNQKNMEGLIEDALLVIGRLVNRGKSKFYKARSRLKGRSKYLGQSTRRC